MADDRGPGRKSPAEYLIRGMEQRMQAVEIAVSHRFLRLEPAEVFYAPLDGSRIDYHPCGRPEDHPTYLDPDSPIGDQRVAPEELHEYRRPRSDYAVLQCGACGRWFYGADAHGQYILHACPGGLGPESLRRVERLQERFRSQTPEAVDAYIARRVRDGRDS